MINLLGKWFIVCIKRTDSTQSEVIRQQRSCNSNVQTQTTQHTAQPNNILLESSIGIEVRAERGKSHVGESKKVCTKESATLRTRKQSNSSANNITKKITGDLGLQPEPEPDDEPMNSLAYLNSIKPKGLINIGNTCFMNAVIQCIVHLPGFSQDIKHNHYGKDGELAEDSASRTLTNILKELESEGSAAARIYLFLHTLKKSLASINPTFDDFGQKDALEFHKTLLQKINDELVRVMTPTPYRQLNFRHHCSIQAASEEAYQYMLGRENSIVTDFFCGQLFNKDTCEECLTQKWSFDHFWDLSLSFRAGEPRENHIYLEDMLQTMVQEEKPLDLIKCTRCHKISYSKIKSTIWKLPKILVLHMKRFQQTDRGYTKTNTPLRFPVIGLDIMPYITEEARSLPEIRNKTKYRLHGIVNHDGNLNGGHYTAICMKNEKWFKFDDNMVTEVEPPVNKPSEAAYILFYARESTRDY